MKVLVWSTVTVSWGLPPSERLLTFCDAGCWESWKDKKKAFWRSSLQKYFFMVFCY